MSDNASDNVEEGSELIEFIAKALVDHGSSASSCLHIRAASVTNAATTCG